MSVEFINVHKSFNEIEGKPKYVLEDINGYVTTNS